VFSAIAVIGSFLLYSGHREPDCRKGTITPKHVFWAGLVIGLVAVFFATADRMLASVLAGKETFLLWA